MYNLAYKHIPTHFLHFLGETALEAFIREIENECFVFAEYKWRKIWKINFVCSQIFIRDLKVEVLCEAVREKNIKRTESMQQQQRRLRISIIVFHHFHLYSRQKCDASKFLLFPAFSDDIPSVSWLPRFSANRFFPLIFLTFILQERPNHAKSFC